MLPEFQETVSDKCKPHAKLSLSGDHLPKMDTASVIVQTELMLPHQVFQDRKLLLPLTSMRQLLISISNTGHMFFLSHEKTLLLFFRRLARESYVTPPVLNMCNNCSYTKGTRTETSCWTTPPHGTLTSVPTVGLRPLLLHRGI